VSFIVVMVLVNAALLWFLYHDSKMKEEKSKQWHFYDKGTYQEVVYGYDTYTRRSGSMVHTTHTYKMDLTAIYFRDGRTCMIKDQRLDMPYPTGTSIWLYQNGNGKIKVLDHELPDTGSETHS
jgi:hypothetical protein